jgi:trehalose 6-phosphate phosphatase
MSPRVLPPPPRLFELDRAALFLDLDGALADIEPRPEDVGPEPWRAPVLRRLERKLGGRLAVVSGRSLEEIDRILEGSVRAVAAVHGLVRRRADGQVLRAREHPAMAMARDRIAELQRRHPALLVEDKGLGVALHYRRAPGLEPLVRAQSQEIARSAGLRLQPGDMVAEICTPGLDKGSAVAAFMREAPFAGATPVFVGDDLTDEDGFRAAEGMGGIGVLVGPGRPTGASRRLPGAFAVRAWLEEAAVMEGAGP